MPNRPLTLKEAEAWKFAKELHNKGHSCVEYLESYPVQIRWCQQEICVKKNVQICINDSEKMRNFGYGKFGR